MHPSRHCLSGMRTPRASSSHSLGAASLQIAARRQQALHQAQHAQHQRVAAQVGAIWWDACAQEAAGPAAAGWACLACQASTIASAMGPASLPSTTSAPSITA